MSAQTLTPQLTSIPEGFKLTVAEVAAEASVAPSAVRFYETHGVISGYRTLGNQRRFDANAACRIKVAKLAQRVGLTVREIAELFANLPAEPGPRDWGRMSDALIVEAEQRVEALKRQLGALGSDSRLCKIDSDL